MPDVPPDVNQRTQDERSRLRAPLRATLAAVTGDAPSKDRAIAALLRACGREEVSFWGWDEQTKKIISGSFDNMGTQMSQSSAGWNGNKMTFEGDMRAGGMTMKARDFFTKVSATELEHMAEVEMNGKWTKLDEETCKKK